MDLFATVAAALEQWKTREGGGVTFQGTYCK